MNKIDVARREEASITGKRKRTENLKKKLIMPLIPEEQVLPKVEEQEISWTKGRSDRLKCIECEEPVEYCKMNFPTWIIAVRRRRSGWGKRKTPEELSLAPSGMGTAPNMTLEEMMDEFFANNMQESVFVCNTWNCEYVLLGGFRKKNLFVFVFIQNMNIMNEAAWRLTDNELVQKEW